MVERFPDLHFAINGGFDRFSDIEEQFKFGVTFYTYQLSGSKGQGGKLTKRSHDFDDHQVKGVMVGRFAMNSPFAFLKEADTLIHRIKPAEFREARVQSNLLQVLERYGDYCERLESSPQPPSSSTLLAPLISMVRDVKGARQEIEKHKMRASEAICQLIESHRADLEREIFMRS